MAKINTLNYQTVASWNGSQDLFVVEQPDGTKVATPEQVRQFVLGDMDEVPTANSVKPVKSGGVFSTMAIPKYDATNRREYFEGGAAFDGNIDSVPTEGSSNMVASGGTWSSVKNKVKKLATQTIQYTSTSTNMEYTGVNVSCPTGHTYIVRAKCDWDNAYTQSIAASDSSTDVSTYRRFAYGDSAYISFVLNEGETAYIWGKWSAASKNRVHLSITDITL